MFRSEVQYENRRRKPSRMVRRSMFVRSAVWARVVEVAGFRGASEFVRDALVEKLDRDGHGRSVERL